ncbi:MAG: serine/threonine protein kinase, partial [Gemmatimonadetes bacterium]|nr:serine/threonine protein kinase [Gemmatimonadota bacterium]
MTMLPAPPDPFPALKEALKDRYVLERELGRGGMAIVYLAREVALDRPVALKVLLPKRAAQPMERERLLREARTAARLSHPNIVPIHAVDQVGEFLFFAMAYVEGETLGRRVRRGRLPVTEAARVLYQVARAVEYAHARGVIHRDLTADNILLEKGSGRALVTDFGIAAAVEDAASTGGQRLIVGTPAYMSPEQARGEPLDVRSDLYALGVVGYYAAGGRLPFKGSTPRETMRLHLEAPAPPLVLEGEDGTALARAFTRCLAKPPGERPQTAAELVAELRAVLDAAGDLPVPVRAFVRRLRVMSRSGTGLTVLRVWTLCVMVGALVFGNWTHAAVAGGMLAVWLGLPTLLLMPVIRRAVNAGSSYEELLRALATDVRRMREELTFEFGPQAEKLAEGTTYASYGLLLFGAGAGMTGLIGPDLATAAMVVGAFSYLFAGGIAVYRYHRRKDLSGEWWLRLWKTRFGRWLVRMAGLGLEALPGGAAPALAPGARATAEEVQRLYHGLPEPARAALREFSDVLR